jgi:hypothetical protein
LETARLTKSQSAIESFTDRDHRLDCVHGVAAYPVDQVCVHLSEAAEEGRQGLELLHRDFHASLVFFIQSASWLFQFHFRLVVLLHRLNSFS